MLLSEVVPRSLVVRGRIGPGDPRRPSTLGPLAVDLERGGPVARERFATLWSDTRSLAELAKAKQRALPPELGTALLEYHHRLNASPASLAAVERLIRGEAVAAVAGQQPAPLGGPLYSLHKTASAVGLASEVESRTGVPCVPVFWTHSEDSDFAEIRSIAVADQALVLHELELPATAHREGGLVGAIALTPVAALEAEGLAHWAALPGCSDVAALLARARSGARDLGEAYSALMLGLFADHGLVVVDPRLPAFRAAARPIIDRYLAHADQLAAAVHKAGDLLETRTGQRPLAGPALESFVFRIEDGERHKVSAAEARALGPAAALSPSVALRPAVQDGVLPTVAMACGAAEVSYLAQLRELFEGVGVRPACPVARISITWLPPSAVELVEAASVPAEDLVFDPDGVLRRYAESRMPADVRVEFERAQADANQAMRRLAETSRRVDPSLPQMVESARTKVDYQFARLLEGLSGKVRHQLDRRHPEWTRLRYYLRPGDRLQERRVAGLDPIARRGSGIVSELCRLSVEHARRFEGGVMESLVVEL
jgi:bacillithiol biosynthesis cysteine-adding enzyme BshC